MSRDPAPNPSAPPARARSWFPGHMHKAQKRLAQEIQHVDVVLEMRDARLPVTSGNPALREMIGARKHVLLFNKASLAAPAGVRRWRKHLEAAGGPPFLFLDADTRKSINLLAPVLRDLTAEARERFQRRGIRPPMQRLMVVGMPNVGKSTFINRFIRTSRLSVAPTPGHTRGVTWVALKPHYLLMDTPGLMLPRLDSDAEALRLGWIGTLRDSIIGVERLAETLLARLLPEQAPHLAAHYGIDDPPDEPAALLEAVARRRGLLQPGGYPDRLQAAELVLHDFRAGVLGRLTLEWPEGEEGV